MKKILILISIISSLTYANNDFLTLEERLERLEQKLHQVEEDQAKKVEKEERDRVAYNNDKVEFHGYFRTGADGNIKEGNKRAYDRAKNIVGRWGNEYDTNFNFNLSRKFTLPNQAWSRVLIQVENWNNIYNNSIGDTELNVTNLYLEMGNLPFMTGNFKEATIIGGKRGWDGVIVDPIDYYYQDIGGTGIGIDKIKFLNGYLNLAYISADFDDKTQHSYILGVPENGYYKENRETAGTIRGYKARYSQGDLSLEMMYAHAVDHNNVGKTFSDVWGNKIETTRNVADNGVYAGLYYNPKNFFGLKGWGQHYLQFSTGVLAGDNGIGRINTPGNMLAHKDSKAYQLGLGGLVNLNEKTNMLVTFRTNYVDKVDSRDQQFNGDKIESSILNKESSLISLNLRPIYTLNQFLDLWLDTGIGKIESKTYKGDTWEGNYYKVSAGPQIRYSIGFAETTIKAYVTYISEDTTNGKVDDIITGLQFVAWW
ncbi:carbohydrate porin [Fusobacterium sp.]|uniref:carbohydrate porin n=1 Tax=Fusobacterium sp. TaxID=68766 RepID=UPI002603D341|nr:carbohydrate porin [Fusobacterium sp.]